MNGNLSRFSLLFLFLIAALGVLMRAVPYIGLPFEYMHLLHSHSHTAFQGWVYSAMILLVCSMFFTPGEIAKRRFDLQFKITIPIVLGIMISFSLQGYGFYSILFSTLFQILNYWFIYSVFKEFDGYYREKEKPVSVKFVIAGQWLGILSTLGPWFVGILSAKGLQQTEPYNAAIYFFLHFQYNGWFLFTAIGLFYKWLEADGESYSHGKAKQFYNLFTIAVIPAYGLSLLSMSYSRYVIIPAAIAALIQLYSQLVFFKSIKGVYTRWKTGKSFWLRIFILTALVSFCIKIDLQFLSVLPVFKELAFTSRGVIISYIHLSLIGVITCFLLGLMLHLGWLGRNAITRAGSAMLLAGFTATEVLLVMAGTGIAFYPELLLVFSIIMAAGILLIFTGSFGKQLQSSKS